MVLGLISILLILFSPMVISNLPNGPESLNGSPIISYIRLLFIYIPSVLFIVQKSY
jgi:hypothetical protein